ncbi:50S ribosomal protein 5 alpha, chloroplastic [Iris pallida]|uniref:50S ribosomal protein 5 alpha, chloroplastic n=1 Tax=Iris pallida TaxID=29817 RepID=A0AAX6FX92_IRIPA|nr:50S ribosomal protein 5 alpha, chloroplastic [Iris pallida]KAJ6831696.1 50S ribosomal protein 5 alpha, chloroplastic [Iris pallida]
MALLLLPSLSFPPSSLTNPSLSSSSSSPPPLSIPIAAAAAPSWKIQQRSLILHSFHGVRIPTPAHAFGGRRSMIVRASAEIDGSESDPLPPSQAPEGEAVVPVENLPLESKKQLMMEQKLRMKLAKKIRLRRKRLVRKRRMRKKGRWPPSKMKKNKNV